MKYRFTWLAIPLLCLYTLSAQSPARAGRDYAVFFTVTDFQDAGWPRLPETASEAEAIAAELREQYGFETEIVRNATRAEMLAKIDAYNKRSYGPDDQVLFFFSTHGYYNLATHGDEGFLIPRDGRAVDSYGDTWLSYADLGRRIALSPCRHVLLSLDACYSGAFGIRNKSGDITPPWEETQDCASQLRRLQQYKTRRYVCSGSKEKRTPARSLFAKRWLEALRTGGSDGVVVMNDLVYYFNKIESPAPENGSFTNHEEGGDFIFVRRTACAATPRPEADPDAAGWQSARRQNTAEAYAFYLEAFPSGRYRAQAQEERLWLLAVRQGTEAAYQLYLDSYPAGVHRGEVPAAKKPAIVPPVTNDRPDGFEFIQGGTFQMGSNDGDSDEKPVHSVTVSNFYLAKYEVTVGEYLRFADETKSHYPEWLEKGSIYHIETGNDRHYKDKGYSRQATNLPVVGVSWEDAKAYCAWLSARTGKTYRLPTEAEWEYAARGGNQSKGAVYAGSNTAADVAWSSENAGGKPQPVGGKKPNELGLYDMSGNVWEWCSDWKGSYSPSAQTNPTGPASGSARVLRGGSWYDVPQSCRVAYRDDGTPGNRHGGIGFRPARTP